MGECIACVYVCNRLLVNLTHQFIRNLCRPFDRQIFTVEIRNYKMRLILAPEIVINREGNWQSQGNCQENCRALGLRSIYRLVES